MISFTTAFLPTFLVPFLHIFKNGLFIYYRKFHGCPNLIAKFLFSEVRTSTNISNDFLQTPYKNFFFDAFSDVIVVYDRKNDGSPNLVGLF